MATDKERLDSMEANGWVSRVGSYRARPWYYVGPLEIEGKPWGVGPTLREAIDDAIAAEPKAAKGGSDALATSAPEEGP